MDPGLKLSIIVAVAENGVIGRNGELPWHLKNDLKRFRELTMGETVIAGRKTHESILRRLGHPLPDRRTIVVTRQPAYAAAGCEVAASFEAAAMRVHDEAEVFVIGGAELYRSAKPYAARVYLTEVRAWPEGDAFFHFPEYYDTAELWREVSIESHRHDAENEFDYTFKVLERRRPPAPICSRRTFVNLENARHDDQRAVMERIRQQSICPFCPANRRSGEVLEPVRRGKHWVVVPNRWPYEFTTLHLLAIPNRHVRMLSELTAEEWSEFRTLMAWAEAEYRLEGGAIGIRFGSPAMTGATVDHLHAHLIRADQDVGQPGYERVRFPMGPKPPVQEKAPDA